MLDTQPVHAVDVPTPYGRKILSLGASVGTGGFRECGGDPVLEKKSEIGPLGLHRDAGGFVGWGA